MDVIWSFPVTLLAIALGLALAVGGLRIGPLHLSGSSIWIPILIIGFVYTPYMPRPIRGEVLSLREKEFVEAAVAQGAGPLRVMFGELLPNLASTLIVFFTLGVANNMLLESTLSFLGVGVQAPNTSWGTMIGSGFELITHGAAADRDPGHDDPAHRALDQRLRRRPARRARPEIEGPARGARGHRRAGGDRGLMARFVAAAHDRHGRSCCSPSR